MKEYRQIQHRLTKQEREGLNNLLAKVKDIRTQAVKEQPESPQKEIDLNE